MILILRIIMESGNSDILIIILNKLNNETKLIKQTIK